MAIVCEADSPTCGIIAKDGWYDMVDTMDESYHVIRSRALYESPMDRMLNCITFC